MRRRRWASLFAWARGLGSLPRRPAGGSCRVGPSRNALGWAVATLARIRQQGYDSVPSDFIQGITNMSRSVRSVRGDALASLTIPFLRWEAGGERPTREQALDLLRDAASKIACSLGFADAAAVTAPAVGSVNLPAASCPTPPFKLTTAKAFAVAGHASIEKSRPISRPSRSDSSAARQQMTRLRDSCAETSGRRSAKAGTVNRSCSLSSWTSPEA